MPNVEQIRDHCIIRLQLMLGLPEHYLSATFLHNDAGSWPLQKSCGAFQQVDISH